MAEQETVAERIRRCFDDLTRAERQLAIVILENYPVSGMGSITALAEAGEVSTPTVVRMARKLGFTGFSELQARLRLEVEATLSDPITKHERWNLDAPDTHLINRFTESVTENMRQTFAQLDPERFDRTCALLGDPARKIFVAGGRITGTLAEYLFKHLQMIRSNVNLVPSGAGSWPHYMLDMGKGDVLVVFDVRRYEHNSVKLAEIAVEKKCEVVLVTDQWGSPAARYAAHCFNCRIEVPSAWDSAAVILILIETMIAKIQDARWQTTRGRMDELETLFDKTGLFRKFK